MLYLSLLADAVSDCVQKCIKMGGYGPECSAYCVNPSPSQSITNPILGNIKDYSGVTFFRLFLPRLLTLGFIIGAVIFFFILIIGAIQWISSGGDKQALEGAKGKISNAVIGLVILFAVFAIIKVAENFFGISILTLDIGSLAI